MDTNFVLEKITDALESRKIEVNEVAGSLNASRGRGPMVVKANLDPSDFIARLAERDPSEQEVERACAGFASGVQMVMLEPKRSKASDWTFEQTAGRIFPSVEVWSYEDGVRCATQGDAPFTRPFHEDLVLGYIIRLDMGMRPLTMAQFDGWTATADRVTSAGRSMLFHETRNVPWKSVEGFEEVFELNRGDGLDAARCTVFADAFFTEVDKSFRFTVPDQDHLLFVKEDQVEAINALKEATIAIWNDSDYPLTTTVFSFQSGRPIPAEH